MKESKCCFGDKGQPEQEEVEVMFEIFPSYLGVGWKLCDRVSRLNFV